MVQVSGFDTLLRLPVHQDKKYVLADEWSFGNKSFSLSLHNIFKNANIVNFVLAVPLEMNNANKVYILECNPLVPTGILFHIYHH